MKKPEQPLCWSHPVYPKYFTMKILIHKALLLAMPCLFFACEKEDSFPIETPKTIAGLEPVPLDCPWTPCDQAIAETQAAYQALANSLQDTLLIDITCCSDGFETYALVLVVPNKPIVATIQKASLEEAY